MIEHARQLSKQGRAVYIIAINVNQAAYIQGDLGPEKPHGIKVETSGSFRNFDWESMTLRGAHPNSVVLVDHAAIEQKYARLLKELHAYDLQPAAAD